MSGAINDNDVNHWKERVNDVLARPSEHINSSSPATATSWHESFFGCCSPIDLCLMTWCLPCVTFGKTHHRLHKDASMQGYEPINTTCLLFCGAGCFGLHWIPMSMQRAAIRAKYNLEGNCLVDIAAACCCALCTLTQEEKETAFHATQNSVGAVKEEYKPAAGMTYPGGDAAPAPGAAPAS